MTDEHDEQGIPDREFVVEGPCPPWCTDCQRDYEAEGGLVIHQGRPTQVPLRTEDDTRPHPVTVRASYCQIQPEARIDPTAAPEPPLVEVGLPDDRLLWLEPDQARRLARVLVSTADLLDPVR